MKANINSIDKLIRIILAVILIVMFYTGILSEIFGITALIVALLLTLTSLLSYCPIYKLLGINTATKKQN